MRLKQIKRKSQKRNKNYEKEPNGTSRTKNTLDGIKKALDGLNRLWTWTVKLVNLKLEQQKSFNLNNRGETK